MPARMTCWRSSTAAHPPIAPDLCMEDTACQAECPVNPKACIVINTAKEVRSLPTPTRDGATFETNVPGCYIIGDVSGVPLIKNAVKEGADVVTHIRDELAPQSRRTESGVRRRDHRHRPRRRICGGDRAGRGAQVHRHSSRTTSSRRSTCIRRASTSSSSPTLKDWFGGIPAAGLGLAKAKYGGADAHAMTT